MQVIVRDRRQGKTTELIKWLLKGEPQDGYPTWSRVIVEPTHKMVVVTTQMVHTYIRETNWNPCERMKPHFHTTEASARHTDVITDVRKAVWGLEDYYSNEQGSRTFEFAVDEMQYLWEKGARILREPAIITVTGKLYTGDDL